MKYRILHYSPVKACKILNASTILHNICTESNTHNEVDNEEVDLEMFELISNEGTNVQELNAGLVDDKRNVLKDTVLGYQFLNQYII